METGRERRHKEEKSDGRREGLIEAMTGEGG